jgi:hypothetical protein
MKKVASACIARSNFWPAAFSRVIHGTATENFVLEIAREKTGCWL